MQEAVAKISNIFYRDFNTNEINDFKSQLLDRIVQLVKMLQLKMVLK